LLRRRLLLEWCAITVFTLIVVAVLSLTRATARVDNAYYDAVIGYRAPPPSDRILIVAIDDSSIASLGRWPWPRGLHAEAVRRIAAARPAALSYDVLFTEPGAQTGEDVALGAALHQAPSVLPALAAMPGREGREIEMVPPIAPVAAGARAIGHVALPHEEDSAGRAALLVLEDGQRTWLHAMEWTYRLAFGHPSPAFARGEVAGRVPFQPRAGAFRTVPFEAIVQGSLPAEFLRGKIVLVGLTAGGLGDRHSVPMREGGTLAGVEVQANLLNALMTDRLVHEASPLVGLLAALLPSLLLLLGFWLLRPTRALIAAFAMILAMLLLPAILLVWGGVWLAPVPALAGLLLAYPLWGWRRLQALDASVAAELRIFATEALVVREPAGRLLGDPIAWQTAQLSASIARLRDLRRIIGDAVEGVADPLFVTDMADRVILANGSARLLLGVEPVGRTLAACLGAVREDQEHALAGRVFSPRRTPLSDRDGTQRGWILLLAEITAIREAEQAREAALEFLSHDMRSPQVSIVTLLEGEGAGTIGADLSQRIEANARRTLELADDFVQLARLGHRRFAPEETDIGDSLAEAMDALWPQARARGVRIVASGLDQPHCVLGERDALTRLFVNLLGNAVRFSPAGGEVRCGVGTSEDGAWHLAYVEDDGPGIDPVRAESLFERFAGTEGRGVSAGLGLAYVRAAAERHGGTVEHVALLPHGARLQVRLPALPSG